MKTKKNHECYIGRSGIFKIIIMSLIFTRSHVSISALVSGFVRPNDILVSSANSLISDGLNTVPDVVNEY